MFRFLRVYDSKKNFNFFTKFLLTFLSLYLHSRYLLFFFPRERKLNALADCILNISRGRHVFTRCCISVFLTFVGEQVLLLFVV